MSQFIFIATQSIVSIKKNQRNKFNRNPEFEGLQLLFCWLWAQIVEIGMVLKFIGKELLDFHNFKFKKSRQEVYNKFPMKNIKALIAILLLGLASYLGVTTYNTTNQVVVEEQIVTPLLQTVAPTEPIPTGPERKLFIFPLVQFGAGLLGGLFQAKANLFSGLLGGGFKHGVSGNYGGEERVQVQEPVSSGKFISSGETGRISSVSSGVNLRRNFNFDGRYSFSLPSIDMEINNNEFVFRGCNTYRVPFLFNKAQFLFGKSLFTRNECNDFDFPNIFSRQLTRVSKLGRNRDTNDILFFNNRNRHLFTAGWKKQLKNTPASASINDGFYVAQLPRYNVQVRGNQMWFEGCESDPVDFAWDNNGRAQFVKQAYGENDCFFNNFDHLTDVFRSSEGFKFGNDGSWYSFNDAQGNNLFRCDRHEW